ncbi:hypothetical protein GQ472_00070 [archaeon]|nr:hypothetical protein [archaeon]
MKKTTVLVSLLVLLAFSGISAYAADTATAIVIKDGLCAIYVPDTVYPEIFTSDGHIVASNDKNDNRKLTCHTSLPNGATPPTKTMHMNHKTHPNIICISLIDGIYRGTTNWKTVITPSGKVMQSCHFNPSEEMYVPVL